MAKSILDIAPQQCASSTQISDELLVRHKQDIERLLLLIQAGDGVCITRRDYDARLDRLANDLVRDIYR